MPTTPLPHTRPEGHPLATAWLLRLGLLMPFLGLATCPLACGLAGFGGGVLAVFFQGTAVLAGGALALAGMVVGEGTDEARQLAARWGALAVAMLTLPPTTPLVIMIAVAVDLAGGGTGPTPFWSLAPLVAALVAEVALLALYARAQRVLRLAAHERRAITPWQPPAGTAPAC